MCKLGGVIWLAWGVSIMSVVDPADAVRGLMSLLTHSSTLRIAVRGSVPRR
jgi:hypothetical protein